MKYRLITIITNLEDVCDNRKLKVTDDVLFSQACSFLRGEFAGARFNKKEVDSKVSNVKKPASKKQLDYLSRNNLDHNAEIITSIEAHKIISEHLKEVKK